MAEQALTVSYPEPRLIPIRQVEFAHPEPLERAEVRSEYPVANAPEALLPGKLLIRIDVEAGRFVQTLTDANSQEMVWRYPSEAQLAFSRAVNAYTRAATGAVNDR